MKFINKLTKCNNKSRDKCHSVTKYLGLLEMSIFRAPAPEKLLHRSWVLEIVIWANQHPWVWSEWIGPIRKQSNEQCLDEYPTQCIDIPTLVQGQLTNCSQSAWKHNELHCLGYAGAAGCGRTAGRELFSCGVWIWSCYSFYKRLTLSCDCSRGGLNTRLFTPPWCERNFTGCSINPLLIVAVVWIFSIMLAINIRHSDVVYSTQLTSQHWGPLHLCLMPTKCGPVHEQ